MAKKQKSNSKALSILITLTISFTLGFLSIGIFEDYGWTIFIFIPFIIGFLPPYIIGRKKELTKQESYSISFLTFGIACICLMVFAIEGLICIIMSIPILVFPVWIGSYIGYKAKNKKVINPTNTLIVLLLCSIGFMGFDETNVNQSLIPVRTKIMVKAPIEEVWNNVITFNKIDAPTDWVFTTGISYPTDATIEGYGVNAIRYCNFTTGSFIEPITTWNEPSLLQFDVIEQPIPMNELNPFWEVHPPHLNGYFQSKKGQFKLNKISGTTTELEGTTWYQVDIQPEFYWKAWSDFIIHRIHKRVLNHIKKESEQKK